MPVTTARHKVLAYLRKTRSASAREIARTLKMSAPTVRYHLSVLCSDGRAEEIAPRAREGKGRPEKIYSLSQAALGNNLSALVDALLTEAGPKVRMEAVAKHILGPRESASQPMAKRLASIVERLTGMNYQARWEAGAEGPRVLFGRCPYAKVIERHPELCKMDAAMLEESLGRPVLQVAKGEVGAAGFCPFAFRVG